MGRRLRRRHQRPLRRRARRPSSGWRAWTFPQPRLSLKDSMGHLSICSHRSGQRRPSLAMEHGSAPKT
eukprot:2799255-Pyramimonas_sp.AAC.1